MMWLLWALSLPDERSPHREAGEAADLDAVRRMASGDAEALAALYDRHGRAVYSLALRVLGDCRRPRRVAQDVFAQAWRQSARYDTSRGVVVAWLLMMSRSRSIDRLRSRRGLPPTDRRPRLTLSLLADPAEGPERADADRGAGERASGSALETLPLVQRMAIELAFYEGLTHVEIAERLEVPLGTIKTRIRLGLMKLTDAFLEGRRRT